MGAWGPRLYQDDLAEEIRAIYTDQLHRGKSGQQITKELMEKYADVIADSDDASVFWFALADTQWDFGRLEKPVKESALYHIHAGVDIEHWKAENPDEAPIRENVLNKLKSKLTSQQPCEKKVPQYKLYRCSWRVGDVYAYPLISAYAKEKGIMGEYFLFHKIGETTCWPGHTIPIVRTKITKNGELPRNSEDFDLLEYVQTAVTRCENQMPSTSGKCFIEGCVSDGYVTDDFGYLPEYRLELMNTSKKVIPKSLVYVGSFPNVLPPRLEFVPDSMNYPGFLWKFFDSIMIERYCGYNLKQYDIYSRK